MIVRVAALCVLAACVSVAGAGRSRAESPDIDALMGLRPPGTDEAAWRAALELAGAVRSSEAPRFEPTTDPGAAWYPKAGLGLFMHWGIHSVAGVQPSWAMIKDYPAGGEADMHPPERYYALANEFDPQAYDPDKWMAAAKAAGFTYAVLTTKHHDGYALWPTAYGDMSTRQYLDGRDLLEPYVAACRKHGLKVGFYFSPRDWHYPRYPLSDVDFDYNKRGQHPPIADAAANQRRFDAFYAYTVGQLEELLTRYGPIDVLWFDGMGWHGVSDIHTDQTLAWIRGLQPHIVMNNRWGGKGDFTTPEWNFPEGRPVGWWENCVAWNGHWGYNPARPFQTAAWALDRLVRARAWGGNFLLNVGPAPDGTMPAGFYERCEELAAWMAHSRVSLIGAGPAPADDCANVPVTTGDAMWYLHVTPGHEGPITFKADAEPERVALLRTGQALPYEAAGGTLSVSLPAGERDALDEVIAVQWPAGQR
ncbi:MAG: alpha-L-fucosidase [Candidatus Hydrogenedentes bacterium]|nr:alpha-L-fucosidase [Candidatus Hydrogenedentota bacterium]